MLGTARNETIRYHDLVYRTQRLFEPGTWLAHPPEILAGFIKASAGRKDPVFLDLGCGAGRNAIPVARAAEGCCLVRGVDLVPTAIQALLNNARACGLEGIITGEVADIEYLDIEEGAYDGIIAFSSLEHLSSRAVIEKVLNRIKRGTKAGGVNLIVINTALRETDLATGMGLCPLLETNLQTPEAIDLLSRSYRGWSILGRKLEPYREILQRDGRRILWSVTAVHLLAQNSAAG